MELYERVSGARMHATYIRIGGVHKDIPKGFSHDLYIFIKQFNSRVNEIEELLTKNRIWKQRLLNIGLVSKTFALNYGFSGVLLRSTGICWDLRKSTPYEIYNNLQFNIPIGTSGDCYDRYLLRVEEIRQSLNIIEQCLNLLPKGAIKTETHKVILPLRSNFKQSMESVIHHFKIFSQGFSISNSESYIGIEAPKGEFLRRRQL